MATKKSSTKAKTKKTASAKSSAKKTEQAALKQKAGGREIGPMHLRSLHMAGAGLFILLALLAGMFMGNDTRQLTIGYLTPDILNESMLAPAVRVIYDVEIRWVLVAVLVLSAVLPVLNMTSLEKKYNENLAKNRTSPGRWLDFAVTGLLMVEVAALLSGVQDVMTLKLIGGLAALGFILSLIAEGHKPNPGQRIYAAAVFSVVLPWLLIGAYALSTVIYGMARAPWYVYSVYGALILGFGAIFCIQLSDYRHKFASWQKNYLVVERNYIAVNVLTKAAFATVLILGFM